MKKGSKKPGNKKRRGTLFAMTLGIGLLGAIPALASDTAETAEALPWGRLLSLGILLLLCVVVVLIGRFNKPKK